MKDSIVSLKKVGQNYVLPLPPEIHPTTESYVVTEGAAGSIILTPVQKNLFKDEAFIRAHENSIQPEKGAGSLL